MSSTSPLETCLQTNQIITDIPFLERMRPEGAPADAVCPVDHKTREKWLEAAKAKSQSTPAQSPPSPLLAPSPKTTLPPNSRYSLDTGTWSPSQPSPPRLAAKRPRILSLDTQREISTIPRSLPNATDKPLNATERAALPANNEKDTGHDAASGNWIYPSQEMFFNAMKRKGHDPQGKDMASIVPIHNAVNERAWADIKAWEQGRGSEQCGGPRLVSFAGDSKALTPRARWNMWMRGYARPFDRHDWVVERCGLKVGYVIDFYSGKDDGSGMKSLSFYLDVRPKLDNWEGFKMRATSFLGM